MDIQQEHIFITGNDQYDLGSWEQGLNFTSILMGDYDNNEWWL